MRTSPAPLRGAARLSICLVASYPGSYVCAACTRTQRLHAASPPLVQRAQMTVRAPAHAVPTESTMRYKFIPRAARGATGTCHFATAAPAFSATWRRLHRIRALPRQHLLRVSRRPHILLCTRPNNTSVENRAAKAHLAASLPCASPVPPPRRRRRSQRALTARRQPASRASATTAESCARACSSTAAHRPARRSRSAAGRRRCSAHIGRR